MTHQSQMFPWFPKHFNRDRFQLILKFIQFWNPNAPIRPADIAIAKVKPVVDHFNDVFKRFYAPDQNLSIDESMIGYTGKTPHLRQFMPQKRHSRFGVKVWCVCESKSGYTYAMEIYQGARNEAAHGKFFLLCKM